MSGRKLWRISGLLLLSALSLYDVLVRMETDQHLVSERAPELLQAFQTVFRNRTEHYHLQLKSGEFTLVRESLFV